MTEEQFVNVYRSRSQFDLELSFSHQKVPFNLVLSCQSMSCVDQLQHSRMKKMLLAKKWHGEKCTKRNRAAQSSTITLSAGNGASKAAAYQGKGPRRICFAEGTPTAACARVRFRKAISSSEMVRDQSSETPCDASQSTRARVTRVKVD